MVVCGPAWAIPFCGCGAMAILVDGRVLKLGSPGWGGAWR
jgi:hypothetical protein